MEAGNTLSEKENLIRQELEKARARLLDLTMRNNLLNFRATTRSTIRIVDEVPREVYDRLVIQGKKMEFRAKSETTFPDDLHAVEDEDESLNEKDLWKISEENLSASYTDKYLQTDLTSNELQKCLFTIRQKAHTILEEQGYNVLYLAIGFLRWKEREDVSPRMAPLILIPVQLERKGAGKPYQLSWNEEELISNISLQKKLEEQDVNFPLLTESDDKEGIDKFGHNVRETISGKSGWEVTSEIYLGFFSFTKFIMYQDLDPQHWSQNNDPLEHPLMHALFCPEDINPVYDDPALDEENISKLRVRDQFYVVDADSSQAVVIEEVKTGRNLVVEGPPGTGKSQTITNLIAELLSIGKSVLFVSEKMAALEVVKRNLDGIGLGDSCLELHSHHTRKKSLLHELKRTINALPPSPINMENDFRNHEILERELNDYVNAIKFPVGRSMKSPFQLYGLREKNANIIEGNSRSILRIKIPDAEDLTPEDYEIACTVLDEISELYSEIAPLVENSWVDTKPEVYTPPDCDEIIERVDEFLRRIQELKPLLEALKNLAGVGTPITLSEVESALTAADVIVNVKETEKALLLREEWNKPNEKAEALLEDVLAHQNEAPQKTGLFISEPEIEELNDLIVKFSTVSKSFYRYIRPSYWKYRKLAHRLYRVKEKSPAPKIIADLTEFLTFLTRKESISSRNDLGAALFGSLWNGIESDIEQLDRFMHWIINFRKQIISGYLTEEVYDLVEQGIDKKGLSALISVIKERSQNFVKCQTDLLELIKLDVESAFNLPLEHVPFDSWIELLSSWQKQSTKLPRWSQWLMMREKAAATAASVMLNPIEEDRLSSGEIVATFRVGYADSVLAHAFRANQSLSKFVTSSHEMKVREFREIDSLILKNNRQRLARLLYEGRRFSFTGASPHSEAGILKGQLSKQRRHMPIRKLLSCTTKLIQKIKPCFMMSPLSIAQYLDQNAAKFDVVIFDEASQVKPEDALGAMLRARQLVVMGDSKQLPPTSFFDKISGGEEYDDEEEDSVQTSITDVESILNQCNRYLRQKMLRWHYRSQHESLIAVSNNQFYESRLDIFPSSAENIPELGLEFKYLPHSVYYRGRSSTNPIEAEAVVNAAIEHYRSSPELSLGIGAFSISQQNCILQKLELSLRENRELEGFFISSLQEYCFVKNLETIQGDERDVILISMGYGFDQNGKLSRNFGPLNRDGGERRLNVLITRARRRCVVFSNFNAGDMDLPPNSGKGLVALKEFLHYAEHRDFHLISSSREDTDSPFEDSVLSFLTERGFDVRTHVGVAGYFIDLAIRDPRNPGQFLLAIECDGAPYHSSPVARDGDRLRQQVLETRGWKDRIHRIWSTDWYRNKSITQENLLAAVARAEQRVSCEPNPSSSFSELDPQGIKRVDLSSSEANSNEISDLIPHYVKCETVGLSMSDGPAKFPVSRMAKVVQEIVEFEGPIHCDMLVNRVRDLWHVRRAGSRIRALVLGAINISKGNGAINQKGEFLHKPGQKTYSPRRRECSELLKIDQISPEEIASGVLLILNSQLATPFDELGTTTAKLFGYRAVHETTLNPILEVIKNMLKNGELTRLDNGLITLPD